ncbi:tetratricopeptide repeat-containing glycosyltransferase family 2 protein [Clostridium transplantifaecale]|uniref:tetratricopeptide repeat-containing glycosyltransferase family 2 protein n=1 Tax=Clostridium transplantifaecale TaxID=2479838 RepID=UPI000F631FB5|nr:glycosyltransferase family 2 protein [Clostridium transplantifaecale]
MKLSIGLIVKNEEKNLDRCLTALQPLLKGVTSELIIVDTGSSDQTVEIAHKYTEKVHFFDWCDDFAEARNYVLDKAKGEWFLYIDADEWFESVSLIVAFLNSSESECYNDACFIIRNYDSFSRSSNYTEEYIKRLFRKLPGRKFEGIVHEHVTNMGKLKFIDEHINHYGYVQDSTNFERNKKNKRNLPLLIRELEKEPDNLLMLYQLAQEYLCLDDKDKIIQTCNKIITKYSSEIDNYYVIKAYWMLNQVYMSRGEYEKIIDVVENYMEDSRQHYNIKMLDVLCQAIDVLLRLKEYEKVTRMFERLFSLLGECDERISHGEEGFGASVWAQDEMEREKRLFQFAFSLFQCRRYRDSLVHLKNIKGLLGDRLIEENVELWHDILTETGEYGELCKYYLKVKQNSGKMEYVSKIILSIWDGDSKLGEKTAQGFLSLPDDDEFVRLIKVYYYAEKNGAEVIPDLEALMDTITPRKEYGRLIYLAQKYDVPLKKYIGSCSSDEIAVLAYQMIELYQHNDDNKDAKCSENLTIKEEFFKIKMLERQLFDIHLTNDKIEFLFDCYTRDKMRYLRKLIRNEMLNENECNNLPGEYCFAVYSEVALDYYEKRDLKNSFYYYRKALKCWPFMKDIISIKTKRIKAKFESEREDKQEFDENAIKIKKYIWKMIQENNFKIAQETLGAYKKINATDKEIEILEQSLNKEVN